jgi:uncharacterized membrane protein
MKPAEFISQLDDAKIVAAIGEAERRTSGEIRVFISSREVDDALTNAKLRFEKLGMTRTRDRNGVLLYFAPRSRQFAICGDSGIDAKCGPKFWEGTAEEVSVRLRAGQFTEAIVHAVQTVGALLAEHFPRRDDDRDELSNEVARE